MSETSAIRLSTGFPDKPPFALIISLAMLAMLGPFTIDMIFPGFPHIGREFNVSTAQLQQITSIYLVAFAGMSLFHGAISDAIGRKRVMLLAFSVYLLASLGTTLAPSFELLLIFRTVQGLSAGGATVISRVIIRDLYSGPIAQRLTSNVMMVFALAPAIAPIIGGWVLLIGTWRHIFFAMFVYAAVTLVLTLIRIPETLPKTKRLPFKPGAILKALVHVGRNPRFLLLGLVTLASQGFFVYISAAPVIIPHYLGLSEQDYWLLFVPIIGGMTIGNLLVGRLSFRVRRSTFISIALPVLLIAHSYSTVMAYLIIDTGNTHALPAQLLMVGPALAGLGAALMMGPTQLEMVDMFPDSKGSATSVASFLLLLCSATIAGVIVPAAESAAWQLAAGALGLVVVGSIGWLIYRAVVKKPV
ncbi:multidrug effflux MFS transporter [Canibacter zhoujuaniae]|uniref:multidrug effflux MFS transporter n=1 Tax=Canibacter zhoujuaniae TaxID=2708343 RepID=UPI001422528B|nr:multidrug effflux MFS transporter [Canibacter zhoujuaniae]